MNLADTSLPDSAVVKLRQLNIRDAETLLSMVATPSGILAIARVLNMGPDAVREFAGTLISRNSQLADIKPANGPFYAMGHRSPAQFEMPKAVN